jgi:hypothetical protein
MATATQSIQNTVNRAVSDARAGDFDALKKDVNVAAQQASQIANKQLGKMRTMAKDNPMAAAGVCLGIGALLGAAIFAIARPMPTPYDQLRSALRSSAKRTRGAFKAGWRSARRAM